MSQNSLCIIIKVCFWFESTPTFSAVVCYYRNRFLHIQKRLALWSNYTLRTVFLSCLCQSLKPYGWENGIKLSWLPAYVKNFWSCAVSFSIRNLNYSRCATDKVKITLYWSLQLYLFWLHWIKMLEIAIFQESIKQLEVNFYFDLLQRFHLLKTSWHSERITDRLTWDKKWPERASWRWWVIWFTESLECHRKLRRNRNNQPTWYYSIAT